MSNVKKLQRCQDALKILSKDGTAVFFTLTTPDVVDIFEIRARWRRLRNWLVRRLGNPAYVMNYELHPGYLQKAVTGKDGRVSVLHSDGESHGWHIHSVFSRFVPLRELQDKIRSYGFGRLDVRRVNSRGISDYLTKHALKAYRGLSKKERETYPRMRLRLVNASRGLPALDDYAWTSPHLENVRTMFREWYDVRKDDCESLGVSVPFREIAEMRRRCEVVSLFGLRHVWDYSRVLSLAASLCRKGARRIPAEGVGGENRLPCKLGFTRFVRTSSRNEGRGAENLPEVMPISPPALRQGVFEFTPRLPQTDRVSEHGRECASNEPFDSVSACL